MSFLSDVFVGAQNEKIFARGNYIINSKHLKSWKRNFYFSSFVSSDFCIRSCCKGSNYVQWCGLYHRWKKLLCFGSRSGRILSWLFVPDQLWSLWRVWKAPDLYHWGRNCKQGWELNYSLNLRIIVGASCTLLHTTLNRSIYEKDYINCDISGVMSDKFGSGK